MSRTFRRDRRTGNKVPDGKHSYQCRCMHCTGRVKQKLLEKYNHQEIREGVDYMFGDAVLDEWTAVEAFWNENPFTLEEEMNWEEYQKNAA